MKLNRAERWVVNNPLRVLQQWIEIQWLKKQKPLIKGSLTLEVGCGRGAGARLIHKEFQPSVIYCLDVDVAMLKKAQRYLSWRELEKVCLQLADVSALPFKDQSMDAVFGFGVLHHVPDWRRAVAEISRVLKPGGVYCIEELYPTLYHNIITKYILFHPREDRFFSDDLRNALEESSLSIKSAVENKRLGILGVAIKKN